MLVRVGYDFQVPHQIYEEFEEEDIKEGRTIRVPKVPSRFLDKLKSDVKNTVINTNDNNGNSSMANFSMLNEYLFWISIFSLRFSFS